MSKKAPPLSSLSATELNEMAENCTRLLEEMPRRKREAQKGNVFIKIRSIVVILDLKFIEPFVMLNIKNIEDELNRRKDV